MNARCKRISVRTMHAVNDKAIRTLATKKKSSVLDVHAKIQRDAERVRRLMSGIPGYRPCAEDAPNILKLVYAAVHYVNTRSPKSRAVSFMYEGKRYPLKFTILGRVIVCDKDGNELGASTYDAIK